MGKQQECRKCLSRPLKKYFICKIERNLCYKCTGHCGDCKKKLEICTCGPKKRSAVNSRKKRVEEFNKRLDSDEIAPRFLGVTEKLLSMDCSGHRHVFSEECCDSLLTNAPKKDKKFKDVSYNIIAALQDSKAGKTSIVYPDLKDKKKTHHVPIPYRGICLFRGDYKHAGAGYKKENARLFISTGTTKFENAGDKKVGLENKKKTTRKGRKGK